MGRHVPDQNVKHTHALQRKNRETTKLIITGQGMVRWKALFSLNNAADKS
jgi:hypothetical protein